MFDKYVKEIADQGWNKLLNIPVYSNKVDLVKNEFHKNFQLKWEELTGSEEGRVQNTNPKYHNRATHCRSTIYTLTRMLKPKRVIEIGAWEYASSNICSLAMDEEEIDGRVDSLDIVKGGFSGRWTPPNNKKVFPYFWYPHKIDGHDHDLWKYNCSTIEYPQFKHMTNEQIFEKNSEILDQIRQGEKYDLVFLDGCHSTAGLLYDFEHAKRIGKDDCVIIIDDLYESRLQTVKDGWNYIINNNDVYSYDWKDWNDIQENPLISAGIIQRKVGKDWGKYEQI